MGRSPADMTEIEYVLDVFEDRMAPYKGSRAVLYGTGFYARSILEAYADRFPFAGVLAEPGKEGTEIGGFRAMGVDAFAESGADMLVIAKRLFDLKEVYERVKERCHTIGCRILDIYGVDQDKVREDLDACHFLTYKEWQSLTEPYDVVSFEICSTLMIRDTFWPARMIVRPVFAALIPYLKARGKTVLYAGWEGQPAHWQEESLINNGLETAEGIRTSYYLRQGKDNTFRSVISRYPNKKILHVGIDDFLDGVFPRIYGIDTWIIRFFGKKELLPEKEGTGPAAHPAEASGLRLKRGDVLGKIREAAVISFDVFDTLIMRRVLTPEDVFELAARRSGLRDEAVTAFKAERQAVQSELRNGTLDEIYKELSALAGETGGENAARDAAVGSRRDTAVLREEEIRAEHDVIAVRAAVVSLMEEARRLGKKVVLTSDMYLTAPLMRQILDDKGIQDYDELFISCERRCLKTDGLFAAVRKWADEHVGKGAKILHIGDSLEADCRPATAAGIETVKIPSVRELAFAEGTDLELCIEKAVTFEERCLLALSLTKLFEDPFEENGESLVNGAPIKKLRDYACGAASPVILGHLSWLCGELQKEKADKVLFASRDGWLGKQLYDSLREALNGAPEAPALPPSVYFYTNRRATFAAVSAAPGSAAFLKGMAANSDEGLTHEKILKSYYGLRPEEILPCEDRNEPLEDYVARHASKIIEHSRASRRHYYRYMRTAGLEIAGRYALVDFVSTGTSQMYLERFAPFDLIGLYYGRPHYENSNTVEYHTYLRDEVPYLLTHYMDMEFIMTSPEPSLDGFDEEGRPVFTHETRSKDEQKMIACIHDLIKTCFRDYIAVVGAEALSRPVIAPGFAEAMYAAFGREGLPCRSYDDWGQFRH